MQHGFPEITHDIDCDQWHSEKVHKSFQLHKNVYQISLYMKNILVSGLLVQHVQDVFTIKPTIASIERKSRESWKIVGRVHEHI